ncbi:M50 family metallopeptidase [Nannocystis sp.]|uniref:M50 family metallopeptidase n=1 Tax=Nannocystis sp. TaxID=1962667 RepID=UPI0025FCAEDB|nr:M50 family metallopeptidase [Nannocystis sp.]MBK7828339.1 M50 family metallopeptidase [Nannocystis sp.]
MSMAARAHERATGQVAATRRARTVLLWSVGLALLLPRIPVLAVLAVPLMWLSTVAHELGHGLTALALGGRLEHFVIRPDGSGTAFTSTSGGDVVGALVSAGGLLGPAIVAGLWFVLGRRPAAARVCLGLFGAGLVAAAVLVADPGFSQAYLGVVGGLALLAAALVSAAWTQFILVFLAVQLALSVFTRGDYLFTAVAESSAGAMPSDVAVMARHLGGPFWLWGLACGLVSLAVLLAGLWFYTRGETRVSLGSLRARGR